MSPRFLGNLFWHGIADRTHGSLRGATQKARCLDLWRRFIQPVYEETGVQTRLTALGLTTVKQDKKGPNLGGTASCVKALVPFGRIFAEHMVAVHSSPTTRAMCAAAQHLERAYQALSSKAAFGTELMQEEGQKFCLQYAALREIHGDGKLWKLTPKFHIFLHMLEDESRPALYWNYRDEAFGGTVARLGRSRGGKKTLTSMSVRVLSGFRIRERMSIIRRTKSYIIYASASKGLIPRRLQTPPLQEAPNTSQEAPLQEAPNTSSPGGPKGQCV